LRQDTMAPVLSDISATLRSGQPVWVVGPVAVVEHLPASLPPPPLPRTKWSLLPYYRNWTDQLAAHLLTTAVHTRKVKLKLVAPVNARENLPLMQFSGYRSHEDPSKPQPPKEAR